jgi:uncharacterized protein (DUF58 family)
LAAIGGPIALVASSVNEGLWVIGLFWCAGLIMACVLDGLLGQAIGRTSLEKPRFPFFSVARAEDWQLACDFGGRAVPRTLEAALDCDSRLGAASIQTQGQKDETPGQKSRAIFNFAFAPLRRGRGMIRAITLRWPGPLRLVWKQKRFDLNFDAPITTNIRGVREEALRWFARNAIYGSKVDRTLGEGSEFHALREFQTGMDRRSLDWKQSARHGKLLAKEYRTERNHNIIFAMDCGRIMSEPVDGAPRIDRAIEAALLTALACLRAGDRAGVFAFDSRPRTSSGALSGAAAFASLQHSVAEIDYSTEETNYVLGLATLSGELKRRSLVIVFTEFADQTAAQLMVEALGRLLKRHLVMFIAFRDEELEALQDHTPVLPEDVSRAVVASTLLSERDLVLARLKAMGVHIVEGSARTIGPSIISTYLDLKARDLL